MPSISQPKASVSTYHNFETMEGKGGAGGGDGKSSGGYSNQGSGGGGYSAQSGGGEGGIMKGRGRGKMKAPGADGYISREAFEKDPQGFFHGLRYRGKGGNWQLSGFHQHKLSYI